MPSARRLTRRLGGWLLLAGLLLTAVLSQARPWLPWDRYFFGRNLELRHGELPSQYPLMAHLSIKEPDLARWKTLRQEYDGLADLIQACRDQGAAVIVLDVLITRGTDSDLKKLWSQVYGQPDVVLVRSPGESIRLPGPDEVAVASLQRDWDGIIRRYRLYYNDEQSPSLAWLAYLRLKHLSPKSFHLQQGQLSDGKIQFPNELQGTQGSFVLRQTSQSGDVFLNGVLVNDRSVPGGGGGNSSEAETETGRHSSALENEVEIELHRSGQDLRGLASQSTSQQLLASGMYWVQSSNPHGEASILPVSNPSLSGSFSVPLYTMQLVSPQVVDNRAGFWQAFIEEFILWVEPDEDKR